MKRKKIILSTLLVGYLLTTSCTGRKNQEDGIEYRLSAELYWSKNVYAGKNSSLNIKLTSDVYEDGFTQHEGIFTDDKKSFLISKKGDTIKAGEKFQIPNIDKNIPFEFYSEDLGEHNMKFIFKNSMDVSITKKQKLPVEAADFAFKITKQSAKEVTVNTPLDIEYFIEPQDRLKHNYELKFNIVYKEKDENEYFFGWQKDSWLCFRKEECDPNSFPRPNHASYEIQKGSGRLTYYPQKIGIRNLEISVNDESGRIQKHNITVKVNPEKIN